MSSIAYQARPFDQAWSLEDTQAYLEWIHSDSKDTSFNRKRTEPEEKLLGAVVGHLMHLSAQGALGRAEHAENLSLPWLNSWNDLLEQRPENPYSSYAHTIKFHLALPRVLYMFAREKSVEEMHAHILTQMASGNFNRFEMGDPQECAQTGAKLSIEVHNWKPVLGSLQPKAGGQWFEQEFVPIQPGQFAAPGVEHVEILVPSGELLIHDWFRIAAFTNATKEVDAQSSTEDDFSVHGRARNTRAYAENLGFVSVFGGSSPSVVLDNGNLRVGYLAVEGNGSTPISGQDLGQVSSQLRACTVIDKAVLVGIVARVMPEEAARQQVEDFLKEEGHSILRATVAPGTYHLYCAGRSRVFAEKFASEEVSMKDFEEPLFVLSSAALTLKDPAPIKTRRPRAG